MALKNVVYLGRRCCASVCDERIMSLLAMFGYRMSLRTLSVWLVNALCFLLSQHLFHICNRVWRQGSKDGHKHIHGPYYALPACSSPLASMHLARKAIQRPRGGIWPSRSQTGVQGSQWSGIACSEVVYLDFGGSFQVSVVQLQWNKNQWSKAAKRYTTQAS